jgi:hypothetical protein
LKELLPADLASSVAQANLLERSIQAWHRRGGPPSDGTWASPGQPKEGPCGDAYQADQRQRGQQAPEERPPPAMATEHSIPVVEQQDRHGHLLADFMGRVDHSKLRKGWEPPKSSISTASVGSDEQHSEDPGEATGFSSEKKCLTMCGKR